MSVSPGTLNYRRHWLASEWSITQQVCKVLSLRVAGQIRIVSGEISRGAIGHTGREKVYLS